MENNPVPKHCKPNYIVPLNCCYCETVWASGIGLSRHLKSVHSEVLGQPPPVIRTGTVCPSLTQDNWSRVGMVPSVPSKVQPEVILTKAEPAPGKIIEVIDLTDDEVGNAGNGTGIATAKIDSAMGIVEVSGGYKVGQMEGEFIASLAASERNSRKEVMPSAVGCVGLRSGLNRRKRKRGDGGAIIKTTSRTN